ncbi:protein dopey-2 [Lates japonicus]|uniref:Protein dopey-2 n=1 Tax=Lates japonicus TaxID=270547 RepID=A0AAD3RGW3_LATJO|nr:protein dopey-2 [Lates japonicus]
MRQSLTLRNFESSSEWADLISSWESSIRHCRATSFSSCPERLIIGEVTAQCLPPCSAQWSTSRLWETCEVIFIIGTKWLAKDLFIYRTQQKLVLLVSRDMITAVVSAASLTHCSRRALINILKQKDEESDPESVIGYLHVSHHRPPVLSSVMLEVVQAFCNYCRDAGREPSPAQGSQQATS